jgi:hypothetical protein
VCWENKRSADFEALGPKDAVFSLLMTSRKLLKTWWCGDKLFCHFRLKNLLYISGFSKDYKLHRKSWKDKNWINNKPLARQKTFWDEFPTPKRELLSRVQEKWSFYWNDSVLNLSDEWITLMNKVLFYFMQLSKKAIVLVPFWTVSQEVILTSYVTQVVRRYFVNCTDSLYR